MTKLDVPAESSPLTDENAAALAESLGGPNYARYVRLIVAIFGVIPWIGGLIAGSAALHAEMEQGKVNEIVRRWLEEHQKMFSTT